MRMVRWNTRYKHFTLKQYATYIQITEPDAENPQDNIIVQLVYDDHKSWTKLAAFITHLEGLHPYAD